MKKFVAGFLSGALMFGIIGAGASGIWDNIEVLRNDIKVVVNGNEITSDNFLYNDTTYLPLRAVSEALNQSVSYDEVTNTAYIGERNDNMQTQEITGKYTPTDEEMPYCELYEGRYYIKPIYYIEKYNLTDKNSLIRPAYDANTNEAILYNEGVEILRVKCIGISQEGYIPYDTYVDEIEPLLGIDSAQYIK